jgi:hypothetical protein
LDDVITGTDPKENASTVAWLCIVACLSIAIATVVNTCYIAYSIHVTIFIPKRDEIIGGWRESHNEELHNLYSLPSIIRMIKPRRMRWTGHVARMGEKRNVYRVFVGKPEG